MELAWGPTWSTSLKSLWVGEGEAVGDVAVGDELAEQLGSEPIHPVLLDLCTGVAFPAFPALLAATEHGEVVPICSCRCGTGEWCCAERMPRRFYCRAKWQTGGLDSETQVFDLDFVDRDGRQLGGIREFTVKRAPREALLRGLGGDATRLLYTLGWHEVPPPSTRATPPAMPTAPGWSPDSTNWRPSCQVASGSTGLPIPSTGSSCSPRPGERGAPISGIVWRSTGRPSAEESSAEFAARLETEIANLLSAVQTLLADEAVKLPGGLWIITERAVATESGEPVDPVQAALWGLGRTIIAEQPTLRCRLVDHDGSDEAVRSLAGLLGAPPSRSPNSHCDKENSWYRGCCRGRAADISRYRARPTTSWRRPNAARSTTCV